MDKTYVGLAMSSTMFSGDVLISRRVLTADQAKGIISGEIVSCFNPSHSATIEALQEKFGIVVPIPEVAPKVTLEPGDSLIVLSARFARRLNEGERFSPEEVNSASFEFVEYTVDGAVTCKECGAIIHESILEKQKFSKGFWRIKCPRCHRLTVV